MNCAGAPHFAALGHQENWDQIAAIVRGLRADDAALIGTSDLRNIIPWIPPRTVSRFRVGGAGGATVRGVCIDTFITPDDLATGSNIGLIEKVRQGIVAARKEGAPIVALGGFTSILLEAGAAKPVDGIAVTTGNTLTAALVLRGIDRALRLLGRRIEDEIVLIIGATGDVGLACARGLVGRTRLLLLTARNVARLERHAKELSGQGHVRYSQYNAAIASQATVVVAVASTEEPMFDLAACGPDTVICDAGYPKNFRSAGSSGNGPRVFWGGMGQMAGGLWSDDGMLERFYRFPVTGVAHGCMIEGAVLALAGRPEAYSGRRGLITVERIDEIWDLAERQGVTAAPLFNHQGLWPEETIAPDVPLALPHSGTAA